MLSNFIDRLSSISESTHQDASKNFVPITDHKNTETSNIEETPDLKNFAHEPVLRSNFIDFRCEHFPTDQLHDIHTEVQDIF